MKIFRPMDDYVWNNKQFKILQYVKNMNNLISKFEHPPRQVALTVFLWQRHSPWRHGQDRAHELRHRDVNVILARNLHCVPTARRSKGTKRCSTREGTDGKKETRNTGEEEDKHLRPRRGGRRAKGEDRC